MKELKLTLLNIKFTQLFFGLLFVVGFAALTFTAIASDNNALTFSMVINRGFWSVFLMGVGAVGVRICSVLEIKTIRKMRKVKSKKAKIIEFKTMTDKSSNF